VELLLLAVVLELMSAALRLPLDVLWPLEDPMERNSFKLIFSGEYGRSSSSDSSGLSGMLACEGISKDLYLKQDATDEDVDAVEDSEDLLSSRSCGSQNFTLCRDP